MSGAGEDAFAAAIGDLVRDFHLGLDRGVTTASLPDELREHFRAWAREHHPGAEEHGDPDDVERQIVDEHEGIEPLVAYFETVPAAHLPAIFRSFRARIAEFYSNGPFAEDDEQHQAAKAVLDRLRALGV